MLEFRQLVGMINGTERAADMAFGDMGSSYDDQSFLSLNSKVVRSLGIGARVDARTSHS